MFERLIEGSPYFNTLSFEMALFSLFLALVLSSAIAFTYKFTYKEKDFPNHFFQALILVSIVTAMIMMSIGNNLAVGIGIIGVVAVIRFRTQFRNPRNIIFIFIALSTGIATGVYAFNIAIAGTVVFCLTAFLLSWSEYGKGPGKIIKVSFRIGEGQDFEHAFEILKRFTTSNTLLEIRTREDGTEYSFDCSVPEQYSWESVYAAMEAQVTGFRIQEISLTEEL